MEEGATKTAKNPTTIDSLVNSKRSANEQLPRTPTWWYILGLKWYLLTDLESKCCLMVVFGTKIYTKCLALFWFEHWCRLSGPAECCLFAPLERFIFSFEPTTPSLKISLPNMPVKSCSWFVFEFTYWAGINLVTILIMNWCKVCFKIIFFNTSVAAELARNHTCCPFRIFRLTFQRFS